MTHRQVYQEIAAVTAYGSPVSLRFSSAGGMSLYLPVRTDTLLFLK